MVGPVPADSTPQIQPITDHVYCSYVFSEKNLCISGPLQFKPMWFDDPL